MRPDKQNINFVNKEVVNYSAIANKAKSLSDGIRSIDFDRINDSITFNSSLVHNRPKINVKPSNNSINNVSEMNFNDNSTLTGITSDSSNTDPTKAISANILTDLNTRFTALESKTQNQTATENETTFTGNITADTFNGYHLGMNEKFYNIPTIPVIRDDLVMEVGRYIDFHYNNSTGIDYKSRLSISSLGTLHYTHSFIVDGGDIKARNCIANGGNLNDIASRTKSLENKNTEQDTRLDTIETKNTEQDGRLDTIETTTIPSITKDISNLKQADTVLHQESVRYYDYSREHIEEIENTKIPTINTKNTEQDEKLNNIIEPGEKYINDKTLSLSINVQKEEGASDYPIADEYRFQLNPVSNDIYLKAGPNAQLYLTITWIKRDEAGVPYGQSYEEIYVSYDGNNVTVNAIEFTPPAFDIETKTLIVPYPTGYNYTLRNYEYTEATLKELYCYHSYIIATPFSNNIIDLIYPIGSIYLTFNQSPPVFGTWELISGGYFLQSTTTSPGETGGSSTHTHTTNDHKLTKSEMPSHNHEFLGNKITGTVYDIMKYDTTGQTNKNPEGAFSVNRYGSRTWQGTSGDNRAFSLTFTATPAGRITDTGNNKAHNHGNTGEASNIPPYIKCYMYKRTA